jgi:hypothetical protein
MTAVGVVHAWVQGLARRGSRVSPPTPSSAPALLAAENGASWAASGAAATASPPLNGEDSANEDHMKPYLRLRDVDSLLQEADTTVPTSADHEPCSDV